MKVLITIKAPGSLGTLIREVTSDQALFLVNLAMEFNEQNPLHSQPLIDIDVATVEATNQTSP